MTVVNFNTNVPLLSFFKLKKSNNILISQLKHTIHGACSTCEKGKEIACY